LAKKAAFTQSSVTGFLVGASLIFSIWLTITWARFAAPYSCSPVVASPAWLDARAKSSADGSPVDSLHVFAVSTCCPVLARIRWVVWRFGHPPSGEDGYLATYSDGSDASSGLRPQSASSGATRDAHDCRYSLTRKKRVPLAESAKPAYGFVCFVKSNGVMSYPPDVRPF
jgi:hypothetical protein